MKINAYWGMLVMCVLLGGALPTQAQTLHQHQIQSRSKVSNVVKAFYEPLNDIVVVQAKGLVRNNLPIQLLDAQKNVLQNKTIYQGSTIVFFDVQTLYEGSYTVVAQNGEPPQQITIEIRRKP